MSHFTVLVITEENPGDGVLERALDPFHEFECTGIDDEYVQDVDITQEALEEYAKHNKRLYRSPTGEEKDAYSDEFYRDPTPEESEKIGLGGTGMASGMSWKSKDWGDGRGYRPKVHFLPEGWKEVYRPASKLETPAQWISDWYGRKVVYDESEINTSCSYLHKYGYVLATKDGQVIRVINRTNPNKKWDWWMLGGRWQGLLIPKKSNDGTHTGSPGLMGSKSKRGGVDSCRKGDLDVAEMKRIAVAERQDAWDAAIARARDKGMQQSEEELDQLRRKYFIRSKAEVEAFRKARDAWKEGDPKIDRSKVFKEFMGELAEYQDVFDDFWGSPLCKRDRPISEWINEAPPICTFAVLKDGKWYERGKIGWWAIVTDEKEDSHWEAEFEKLILETPDDHWLSVVDCHI